MDNVELINVLKEIAHNINSIAWILVIGFAWVVIRTSLRDRRNRGK